MAAVIVVLLLGNAAAACPGDCDGDGSVYVSELLRGVNIALGRGPISSCPSIDVDMSNAVTVDEIVASVDAVLLGCPGRRSPSPTLTVTPTPRPNQTPVLDAVPLYRAYPDEEIRFNLPASDPDGGPLHFLSDDLPSGATLDEHTGEFHWIPTEEQVGLVSIPVTVVDEGDPALEASNFLFLEVRPLDGCAIPDCDPATGCSSSLPTARMHCCLDEPLPRVYEPSLECDGTGSVFLGRNAVGFGRLQNCDEFRVRSSGQGGASVVLNMEVRCLNTSAPILVHSEMDSTTRFVFEDEQMLRFTQRDDGFADYKYLQLRVQGRGPYNDMQGQEANLAVTVTDVDGVSASEAVRLRLTFTPIPDLPEATDR